MSVLAIRLAQCFWILWVAAGCGTSNQTAPTTQTVRYEAPSSESQKQAAIDAHVNCLYKNAREMDDGRSDASTIATAIRSTCRSLYNQSLIVFSQGSSPQVKRVFYDRSQNNDVEMATTAVLRTRANANKPPTARPSGPTSTPVAPPPMIPPG